MIAVGMEERYQLVTLISCTIFPFYGTFIYLTKKEIIGKYVGVASTFSNTLSGNLTIYLATFIPDGLDFMLPAIVFNVLFALYQMRLSLIQTFFGPLTYMVGFIFYLFFYAETDWIHIMIYSFLTVLTIGFVVLASYLQELTGRKLFSKNQLIIQQANDLEIAHESLHEKNTELLDSIHYAKRIQTAILPPDALIKTALPDSFILYKPKDIVAGDFYWLFQSDTTTYFAAADCTGHGVPGAMVSVICNSGLNRSVNEFGLSEPGEILDQTRDLVIQEFEKSDEDVMDGMDIALCALNGMELKYAGASNPLWIIRNGELLETKANKQPIGKYFNRTSFDTHTIALEKGDILYLFSDGYADQFGGEKGKKLKSSAFKKMLIDIHTKPMSHQKEALNTGFETWQGNHEQIDDVCVIGVRIP